MKPSSTRTSSLAATVAANDSVADETPFQSMPPTLLIVADLGLLKAYKVTATPRGALHLDLRESVVLEEDNRRVVDRPWPPRTAASCWLPTAKSTTCSRQRCAKRFVREFTST